MPSFLIQSNLAGNGSATAGAFALITATATGTFGQNTSMGSHLVTVAWLKGIASSHIEGEEANLTLTTSGVTWTQLGIPLWENVGVSTMTYGATSAWYANNAAAVASTTTLTLKSGSLSNTAINIEFAVYEFGGLATGGGSGGSNIFINQSGTVTAATNVNLGTTDLVFMNYYATPGSNLAAGSGFTLGPNASVVTTGQAQYKVGVPTGSITAVFAGSQATWASGIHFFPEATVAATAAGYSQAFILM